MVRRRAIHSLVLLMSYTLLQSWVCSAHAGPMKCEELFVSHPKWYKLMSEWTTPPAEHWSTWVQSWEREGHHPEDIERVSKLVRTGEINEAEGRAIIEKANIDTLEYLAARGVLSAAEFSAIERAFLMITVDGPLGEPEIIPTFRSSERPPRREYVLAQEFRGISSPDSDRELVLSDPITKRKLGTLTFFFEGYRHLAIARRKLFSS